MDMQFVIRMTVDLLWAAPFQGCLMLTCVSLIVGRAMLVCHGPEYLTLFLLAIAPLTLVDSCNFCDSTVTEESCR